MNAPRGGVLNPGYAINGWTFEDVTDKTVAGITYSPEEALAFTQGKEIATSD